MKRHRAKFVHREAKPKKRYEATAPLELPDAFHVWTDGSAWHHPTEPGVFCGGAAYIIVKDGQIFRKGNYGTVITTNNRMEMLAIICGIGHCPKGANIIVHSDSRYAINVLSGRYKAHVNTDLVDLHKKYSTGRNIQYQWVKGHSGNEYNETCDLLANKGRIEAMRREELDWEDALMTTNQFRKSKGEAIVVLD